MSAVWPCELFVCEQQQSSSERAETLRWTTVFQIGLRLLLVVKVACLIVEVRVNGGQEAKPASRARELNPERSQNHRQLSFKRHPHFQLAVLRCLQHKLKTLQRDDIHKPQTMHPPTHHPTHPLSTKRGEVLGSHTRQSRIPCALPNTDAALISNNIPQKKKPARPCTALKPSVSACCCVVL